MVRLDGSTEPSLGTNTAPTTPSDVASGNFSCASLGDSVCSSKSKLRAVVEQARAIREHYPPDPDAPLGSHAVMRTGEPQLIAEIPDDLLVDAARDEEHLKLIRALHIRSAMSVPMVTGGRALGVMSFVFSDSERVYSEQDLAFAQELGARAATAIENARLYTERAEVARTLQASLLPEELPEVPGWRFAAEYRAGQEGADVGGDFYDVFAVEGGPMVLLGT